MARNRTILIPVYRIRVNALQFHLFDRLVVINIAMKPCDILRGDHMGANKPITLTYD